MAEEREMDQPYRWKNNLRWLGIAFLFVLGILARTRLQDISGDMVLWLIPWYDYIHKNGILIALGDNFSNYTPPYTYLLSLITLIPIPKVVAIKLISITMDFVNAFIVYKIVRCKYPSGLAPLWAAGGFLCLPTIFINSAFWGQADSIYTGFLLIALYFFLQERPFWGMLAFSVSFAFKAQAVFMAPFLAVLFFKSLAIPREQFFKKTIRFWHFFLVPGVYIFLCLPVILLGRNWINVLTIYLHQSNEYQWLSANAPNLYILIPDHYYQPGVWIGLVLASIGIGLWIAFTTKSVQTICRERLVLVALISVALSPFLLPKMHDRYFYPTDVFSFVVAFFSPELWFLPLAFQVISGLSYMPFLLGYFPIPIAIATAVNTTVIIFLLRRQFRNSSNRSH